MYVPEMCATPSERPVIAGALGEELWEDRRELSSCGKGVACDQAVASTGSGWMSRYWNAQEFETF